MCAFCIFGGGAVYTDSTTKIQGQSVRGDSEFDTNTVQSVCKESRNV